MRNREHQDHIDSLKGLQGSLKCALTAKAQSTHAGCWSGCEKIKKISEMGEPLRF